MDSEATHVASILVCWFCDCRAVSPTEQVMGNTDTWGETPEVLRALNYAPFLIRILKVISTNS